MNSCRNSNFKNTMTVAIVDGNPLLPLKHTEPPPLNWDNIFAEDENKHPNAPFNIPPQNPSTECHVTTDVETSNGCTFSNHEPMMEPQPSFTIPPAPTTCTTFFPSPSHHCASIWLLLQQVSVHFQCFTHHAAIMTA